MNLQKDTHSSENPGAVPAENTSREFENFIYLVSHDVRNSVRALLELPHWIQEDLEASGTSITGSLAENIELMNTHTRRLDRMLIDLLIYSRIGRMQAGTQVDWNDAIDAVVDQVQIPEGFRIARDIRIPTIKMGETDAMTLISSLITNAIKHHDRIDGAVHISTADINGELVLSVRDDGPGIPERHREKVFQAMTTLKPRDEIEGSGMGLANVRKIAALYNARIEWPESGADRGCHLRICFPQSMPTAH